MKRLFNNVCGQNLAQFQGPKAVEFKAANLLKSISYENF